MKKAKVALAEAEEDRYEAARQRYLSRETAPVNEKGAPYPRREELYERGRSRA